ncbi:WYL domain-containing protein [uncultured Prevotella sp.]|uniref:WYL domain-containing protein n=1 Tax=uncultured Prevotella sp. TaxID=159272 RepID=UPI0027E217F7|nr:WYL domain-containing protein [uncultured Prevotella sp.]
MQLLVATQPHCDRQVRGALHVLNNDRYVRCHEICCHQNKTFKLSRMEKVELMDMPWANKAQHKQLYTDIFMFSGEERYHVKLLLGQLSHNIMVEEYPLSEPSITLASDGIHWILDIEVASFMGIGRFVMGLYDDIKVLGDEQFKTYINEKVALIKKSIQ